MEDDKAFIEEAIRLARENVAKGGRPFGAVVVKDGTVIASGVNEMLASGDPTSHAELNAVRAAAHALASPRLDGCRVYASGHPCPMCLAAMYMTGIRDVAYAYSNEEGEPYGLSTSTIYEDLGRPLPEMPLNLVHVPVPSEPGEGLYDDWARIQREAG